MPSEQEEREEVERLLRELVAEGQVERITVIREGQPVELFRATRAEDVDDSSIPKYTATELLAALAVFATVLTNRDKAAMLRLFNAVMEAVHREDYDMAIELVDAAMRRAWPITPGPQKA